jgi:ADP-ribose pyrophosphatase YjhB (NUDIX family)
MKNNNTLKHPLQEHIISTLRRQEFTRFKDILPPKTDTNVFSYHVKILVKADFIKKVEDRYTLSQNGIIYVHNLTKNDTNLPVIQCVILLQNSDGDILLTPQSEQPYINTLSLPGRYVHAVDSTIEAVASGIISEQIGLKEVSPIHVGDAYVRVKSEQQTISTTITHVFRVTSDDVKLTPHFMWVQPHKLSSLRLTPGTESIIARSFFGDTHFFEEFDEEWTS